MDNNLIDEITDRFTVTYNNLAPLHEDWKRYYDMYRSRADARKDPEGKSNLFIPETFTLIETLIARLVSPFLVNKLCPVDIIEREPRWGFNVENVKALLLNYLDKADFPIFLTNFMKQGLMYSATAGKVYWDFDRDHPKVELVDVFDLFPDLGATRFEDCRFVIHRKFMSIEELEERAKAGVYKNVSKIKGGAGADNERSSPRLELSEDDYEDNEFNRDVEILEYWTPDRVVTLANREVILRDEENPFHDSKGHTRYPFVFTPFTPIPLELFGIGLIESVEGLQNELNCKRNQRLDNVNLILNRMWLVQRGTIDDMRQLRSRPGGVIFVNDLTGIRALEPIDVTASSYQEEDRLKRDIANITGQSEFARGTLDFNSKVTATEVQLKTQAATNRLDYNFRFMAKSGVEKICQHFLLLAQQFMKFEQLVRIYEPRGHKILNPKDIEGEFDFSLAVDPLGISRQEKIDNLKQALATIGGIPGLNTMPIVRKLLRMLEVGEDEIAELFAPQIKQPVLPDDVLMPELTPQMPQGKPPLQKPFTGNTMRPPMMP